MQLSKIREIGIGDRYKDAKLSDIPDDYRQIFIKYIKEIKEVKKKGYGIYIYGDNGLGKSHALAAMIKACVEININSRIVTIQDLKEIFAGNKETAKRLGTLETLRNIKILGIEEIGKDPAKTTFFEYAFENFIRYRSRLLLPTIYASNLNPAQFLDFCGKSSYNIMAESCYKLEFKGNNFRREKAKEIKEYFE